MVKICRGATNVAMATRTLEPDEASLQGSVATQPFMCGVSFAVSRSGPRPRPQNIRRYVKSLLVCVSVSVSISIIVTRVVYLSLPGMRCMTAAEHAAIRTLATYLAGLVSGGEVSDVLADAIDTVFSILNCHSAVLTDSDHAKAKFTHICCSTGTSRCKCGFYPWDVQRRNVKLARALKVLLFRHSTRPSLSRWTTMGPAMAYFAMWQLIDEAGASALRSALGIPSGKPLSTQWCHTVTHPHTETQTQTQTQTHPHTQTHTHTPTFATNTPTEATSANQLDRPPPNAPSKATLQIWMRQLPPP
jgi:hypothetical protein